MNLIRLCILFAVSLLVLISPKSADAAQCNCRQESYYVCDGTCNQCGSFYQPDSSYPKKVNVLPFNFNYSHADTNGGNDVCGSSDCGTKNCNAGTTFYSNTRLPANGGYCTLTPNNRIPASLSCGYADGYCQTYCSRGHTNYYTQCDQC